MAFYSQSALANTDFDPREFLHTSNKIGDPSISFVGVERS